MPHLGVPELLIILVIVIIVFGVGKLPQIGGAIGQSIREFRNSAKTDENAADKKVAKSTVTDEKKEETEKV